MSTDNQQAATTNRARDHQNIVITGFMGTGKSTVGQLVAEKLDWPFVDADAAIVERVGMSIPKIFEREGEPGFRRHEAQVCKALAARSNHVIATGGGMLVNAANRAEMLKTGFVVCLTARPEVIKQRLADFEGRPLAPNWQALLTQRQPAYAQIPVQVDTSQLEPAAVAQEIIRLWRES